MECNFLNCESFYTHNLVNIVHQLYFNLKKREWKKYFVLFVLFVESSIMQGNFFLLLRLHLRHMEVPRLGVELELQLLAYTTAMCLGPTPQVTAMPDL